jgi:hypothetical protein
MACYTNPMFDKIRREQQATDEEAAPSLPVDPFEGWQAAATAAPQAQPRTGKAPDEGGNALAERAERSPRDDAGAPARSAPEAD